MSKSTVQETKDEILVRAVEEIVALYDPEAIRLAAEVRSGLPHMQVVEGEIRAKETTREQIFRQLGRACNH